MPSKNPYEFCQHSERGLRCVGGNNHVGAHDLQGPNSASVRAIEQREFVLGRLGYDKPEGGHKPAEDEEGKIVPELLQLAKKEQIQRAKEIGER